ncbi:Gfo/Idh/MocA family protein [Nocardioides sp. LML1-1-1.1]|uniref:Gfo/Idh/MocA family protein n=1 Tax=Nocardioides sp. LML1-1-1.1 TaxID=3135248 RepID=UPI00342A1E7F
MADTDSFGWGILATGKIARSFAADLALVPGARLAAVGSRSTAGAEAFVAEHGTPQTRAHGSYDDLLADPDVDVVYVATPHALHLDNVRAAFAAGKHVLCEKALTLRAADAEEMVRLAHEHDRFLMEAMWMACHPVVRELRAELASGRFGRPRHVAAELGFRVDAGPADRMFAPELGGGALLDMGIYPLTFAHLMLGEAEELAATASLAPSGIDLDIAIAGRYPGGALATLNASMTSWSSRGAAIATDQGRIELQGDFHHPTAAVFTPAGRPEDAITLTGAEPVVGRGYGNEVLEVQGCLAAGLRESPLVPHEQTLTLLRQMDALRASTGIRYPDDPA